MGCEEIHETGHLIALAPATNHLKIHMKAVQTAPSRQRSPEKLKQLSRQEEVLVCMYSGLPEPPTLNALLVLSDYFGSVTMLRNNLDFPAASYPLTPRLQEVGSRCDVKTAASRGTAWKLGRFAKYCLALFRALRTGKYRLVVIHDYLGLLAWWLVKNAAGYKGLVWFNSYDVIDMENVPMNRFSLMRMVVRNHEKLFGELDFFSLPAAEREPYYPCDRVKKATFVIPNFPSLTFYKSFYKPKNLEDQNPVKLIYQGALGPGHGYESIIGILHHKVAGRPLHLVLKGWIDPAYKEQLLRLAEEKGVADKLSFHGFSLYRSVPELAASCTIGLAIFTKQDVMNKTLGTASNKIYEYAAVGLPVVLFDTPHFRQYLEKWDWAYFTDLSAESLLEVIAEILKDYPHNSRAAHESFRQEFNFEKVFEPALATVLEAMYPQLHVKG